MGYGLKEAMLITFDEQSQQLQAKTIKSINEIVQLNEKWHEEGKDNNGQPFTILRLEKNNLHIRDSDQMTFVKLSKETYCLKFDDATAEALLTKSF